MSIQVKISCIQTAQQFCICQLLTDIQIIDYFSSFLLFSKITKQPFLQRKSEYYSSYMRGYLRIIYDSRRSQFPYEFTARNQYRPDFQDSCNLNSTIKINQSRSTVTTSRFNRSGQDSINDKMSGINDTLHERSYVKCNEYRSSIEISDVVWDELNRKNLCSYCNERKQREKVIEPENEREKLNAVKRAESQKRILINQQISRKKEKKQLRFKIQEKIQQVQNENEDYEHHERNMKTFANKNQQPQKDRAS